MTKRTSQTHRQVTPDLERTSPTHRQVTLDLERTSQTHRQVTGFGEDKSHTQTGHSGFGEDKSHTQTGHSGFGEDKSHTQTGHSGFGEDKSHTQTGHSGFGEDKSHTQTGHSGFGEEQRECSFGIGDQLAHIALADLFRQHVIWWNIFGFIDSFFSAFTTQIIQWTCAAVTHTGQCFFSFSSFFTHLSLQAYVYKTDKCDVTVLSGRHVRDGTRIPGCLPTLHWLRIYSARQTQTAVFIDWRSVRIPAWRHLTLCPVSGISCPLFAGNLHFMRSDLWFSSFEGVSLSGATESCSLFEGLSFTVCMEMWRNCGCVLTGGAAGQAESWLRFCGWKFHGLFDVYSKVLWLEVPWSVWRVLKGSVVGSSMVCLTCTQRFCGWKFHGLFDVYSKVLWLEVPWSVWRVLKGSVVGSSMVCLTCTQRFCGWKFHGLFDVYSKVLWLEVPWSVWRVLNDMLNVWDLLLLSECLDPCVGLLPAACQLCVWLVPPECLVQCVWLVPPEF